MNVHATCNECLFGLSRLATGEVGVDRLHVIPLSGRCLFSRVWHRLPVFPRLAPVTCFPAFGTGYLFSRVWHQLPVFPHLAPVACFSAFGTGYLFSRVWHQLPVFPRVAPVASLVSLSCILIDLISFCCDWPGRYYYGSGFTTVLTRTALKIVQEKFKPVLWCCHISS